MQLVKGSKKTYLKGFASVRCQMSMKYHPDAVLEFVPTPDDALAAGMTAKVAMTWPNFARYSDKDDMCAICLEVSTCHLRFQHQTLCLTLAFVIFEKTTKNG